MGHMHRQDEFVAVSFHWLYKNISIKSIFQFVISTNSTHAVHQLLIANRGVKVSIYEKEGEKHQNNLFFLLIYTFKHHFSGGPRLRNGCHGALSNFLWVFCAAVVVGSTMIHSTKFIFPGFFRKGCSEGSNKMMNVLCLTRTDHLSQFDLICFSSKIQFLSQLG